MPVTDHGQQEECTMTVPDEEKRVEVEPAESQNDAS